MPATPATIRSLVEAELLELSDARVVSHIQSLLVEPQVILREWDYGTPGEAYPCWSVLAHEKSNTGIAYCEQGFGPRSPWGLVVLSGSSHMSIGMDSGWFETFLQAYFDSAAATELSIWQVFKQEADTYPGIALTDESDWSSTWEKVYRLRVLDPSARYHCSTSIQVRRE
jgi:hypothetical protein